MQKLQLSVFVQNHKNSEMEIFAFYAISFEPIRIQIHYACQNDRLNLSFVKDKCTDSKKVARNGCKMATDYNWMLIMKNCQEQPRLFFTQSASRGDNSEL